MQVDEVIRCQWCGARFTAEAQVCPSCGSAVARKQYFDETDAASTDQDGAPDRELVEWWNTEPSVAEVTGMNQRSVADIERRKLMSLVLIGGTALSCVVVGWLAGPLLAPLLEGITGSPADDTGALRSLGAFVGFLFGMLLGAIGGWIAWAVG
ncbi:MAG: hypothetical protein DCC58_04385 [Chloroflexi bacterium]|nr:MAG: hypothetical protein DCC58_04385 [Chloroflexota bacterium]